MSITLEPGDLLIVVIGFALLLKKVADMDRYETLRTIVLTAILGAIVIYVFLAFVPGGRAFEPDNCEPEHFCLSEM